MKNLLFIAILFLLTFLAFSQSLTGMKHEIESKQAQLQRIAFNQHQARLTLRRLVEQRRVLVLDSELNLEEREYRIAKITNKTQLLIPNIRKSEVSLRKHRKALRKLRIKYEKIKHLLKQVNIAILTPERIELLHTHDLKLNTKIKALIAKVNINTGLRITNPKNRKYFFKHRAALYQLRYQLRPAIQDRGELLRRLDTLRRQLETKRIERLDLIKLAPRMKQYRLLYSAIYRLNFIIALHNGVCWEVKITSRSDKKRLGIELLKKERKNMIYAINHIIKFKAFSTRSAKK